MPSSITLLATCLIAASVAIADDQPADQAGQSRWSNTQSAASSDSGPKVTEYGPAAIPRPHAAETAPPPSPAGSGAGSAAPAYESRPTAEYAPDPPALPRPDVRAAVYEQDSPRAAEGPAADTRRVDARVEQATASELVRSAAAGPQPQLLATDPAANPVHRPAVAGAPPAMVPSSPAAPRESAGPLGLGSGRQVLLVDDKNAPAKRAPLSAMITVGGSLATVLGLFFLVAWAMRKTAPRGSRLLPTEVFDILGRAPLGARQQVQLLRCGNKLLLVSITPNGAETLTEVTDPLEVDRLADICRQAQPKSAKSAFRQVFQQVAAKSAETSELDDLGSGGAPRKRFRWEEKHA